MSVYNQTIETPAEPCVTPKGDKGGPGTYDHTPGTQSRTSSPNAAPEKFYEEAKGAKE